MRIAWPRTFQILKACALALSVFLFGSHAALAASQVLVGNGASRDAYILVPAKPSALESYAAAQIAKAIQRMTGSTLPVVNEGSESPSDERAIISVGRTSVAKDVAIEGEEWKRTNPEAFRILRRDNVLIICGNQNGTTPDFGTAHGAYAFMKMQGVGSYMNGEPLGIVYPRKKEIAIADDLDVSDAPWFQMRDHDDTIANYLARAGENPPDLIAFDGLGAFARMEYNHKYQYIATPEVRKAHPEWFAGTHNSLYGPQPGDSPPIGWGLSDNGICLTRPEVRNLFVEYFRQRFRENPDLHIASICPDDYNLGYRCECDGCMRLINMGDPLNADTKQRSASDLHIDFVNAVATELEKDFPDRKLITYAYIDYISAPKKTRVHPNVVVMIVGYWNNSTPEMDKVIGDWRAMGARTIYWYGWMLTRPPIPHRMGEWYRNFKRQGIAGVYMEYSAVPVVNMINGWLSKELAWDPDADVGKLLDEYFFGLFGPEVGLQMRRFFSCAWETQPAELDLIPGFLAVAERMAGDSQSDIAKRVQFFKLSWDLYRSPYDLDAALKAADIPRAHQIVTSANASVRALEKEYPWSIKSDVWLYNTAHMEYSVAVLPALEILLNSDVAKPRPERRPAGKMNSLTDDAAVTFDTKVIGGHSPEKLLFDGQTQGGVSPESPLPEFSIILDLKKARQVDHVEVCVGATESNDSKFRWDAVPIFIEIQTSDDGVNFMPVERILPRTLKGFARSDQLGITTRHLKLRFRSLNLKHDVNEIRVWGHAKQAG